LLALFGWVGVARLVRATALSVLARDFVRAARAMGVPERRILWRHVLPELAAPVAIATALAVGGAVLAESTLSFLGLGIAPPAASWATCSPKRRSWFSRRRWPPSGPGLAILLTVLACKLGGGWRQAPRGG
jgi:peptide/nickel transport system permease protein